SVLLRRRKQREGESRPPAQARLRGRQRLRNLRQLHEQAIEAAVIPSPRRGRPGHRNHGGDQCKRPSSSAASSTSRRRAAVFALLTDPEKLLRWMGTEAQVEPQPGGLVGGNVDPGIAENGRELGHLEKRVISIPFF